MKFSRNVTLGLTGLVSSVGASLHVATNGERRALDDSAIVPVIIIGAGMAGAAAAKELPILVSTTFGWRAVTRLAAACVSARQS